jgi:hypothetical protein
MYNYIALTLVSGDLQPSFPGENLSQSSDRVEWFTRLTIASLMGSKPCQEASRCFLEKETLYSLLSTGWFQEQIQKYVYKLTAPY